MESGEHNWSKARVPAPNQLEGTRVGTAEEEEGIVYANREDRTRNGGGAKTSPCRKEAESKEKW